MRSRRTGPSPSTAPAAASNDSAAQFRAAMAQTPSPVAVVTTLADDEPFGTTVSAFMSLSMNPPMLLVSLDNGSMLLSKIHLGSVLGVNVLSAGQDAVASHFARKGDDKFAGRPWSLVDDAPTLPGRHAWITLTATELTGAGDHTLVFGSVRTAAFTSGTPLTYWSHTFGTHTAA